MNELRHGSPRLSCTYIHTYIHTYMHTYKNYPGWAVWAIIQQDYLHIHACLPGVSYDPGTWKKLNSIAYLRMFSGGELRATDEQARDLSATCEKLRQRQRPKGCITFASTLIGSRRSAVNPTIDQLPHRAVLIFSDISMSLARFLCWTISHFFKYLGDYSPCVGKW